MNHLVAFFQSIDSATLVEINNVVDDVLTRVGTTRFLVPTGFNNILWAAALGPNITRAQIWAPSLGVQRQSFEVIPRRRGGVAFAPSHPEIFLPGAPIPLIPSEELSFAAAEDGTGATALYGLVALGPATAPAMPTGPIRAVRATGATTLVANTWTTVTVTPELSLEPGSYALVGFIPISATCIAARALITGQVFRPGVPGLAGSEAAAADHDTLIYRQLMYENMGTFTHINPPQFQFLATGSDTSQTVIMYVVRTGGV